MRITQAAVLIALTAAFAGKALGDDKDTSKGPLPPGAISADDLKKQAGKQQMTGPAPRRMSQSRSGIGDFFRRLFGPSEPKINGTVIRNAQTYKNGIMPVAPIAPR